MRQHGTARTSEASAQPGRERLILEAFVDLADSLVDDYDALDFLHRLLEHGLPLTGASDGAVLLHYEGRLHLVASANERSERLAVLELQADEGPAHLAFTTGEPVRLDWTAEAPDRWPAMAREAEPFGWGAAFAVPLRLRDHIAGSLVVYWVDGAAPRDHEGDEMLLRGLADVGTIAVLQQRATADVSRINDQLHRALESRIKLEQAKGMIAQASGADMGEAFDLLRRHARSTNQRLSDVARAVVRGDLHHASLVSPQP